MQKKDPQKKPHLHIDVISIFPDMFSALQYGINQRALSCGLVSFKSWNLRDFASNTHGYVDDRPYGGGPGMVLQPEPLAKCIEQIPSYRQQKAKIMMLTPSGLPLSQNMTQDLCMQHHWIMVCGRYEGVDQRFIDQYVDTCVSIGDYILSGGELAAMVVIDTMIRTMPQALGNHQSVLQDSFSQGNQLDWPTYTRPQIFKGQRVPQVLLDGNHQAIADWRETQAKILTQKRQAAMMRFDGHDRSTDQSTD